MIVCHLLQMNESATGHNFVKCEPMIKLLDALPLREPADYPSEPFCFSSNGTQTHAATYAPGSSPYEMIASLSTSISPLLQRQYNSLARARSRSSLFMSVSSVSIVASLAIWVLSIDGESGPHCQDHFSGAISYGSAGLISRSGAAEAAPAIPALESALGSHSCGALSSAQVPLL